MGINNGSKYSEKSRECGEIGFLTDTFYIVVTITRMVEGYT